jgi:hypothetical protein
MDQGPLVSEQIEDGKRFLERLAAQDVPVTAAAWIKESERPRWYLYLATPLVPKQACPPSPAGLPARARGDGTSPSPPGRWLLGTLE